MNDLIPQSKQEPDAADVASAQRVQLLRQNNPDKSQDALVNSLIQTRCLQVARIGVAKAGAAVLPTVGLVASMAIDSIPDLGPIQQHQAELLLDIATIYGYKFQPEEKERYFILALGVNGRDSAESGQSTADQLIAKGGQQLAQRATQSVARRGVGRALPAIGVASTAGSNILVTYTAAYRARTYIKSGPESVGDWETSVGRAMAQLKQSAWTSESLSTAMSGLSDTLMEGFDQGAQQAGRAAGRATRKLINFWRNATTPKD